MPMTFQIVNADAIANRVGSMIGRIGYFAGVEMPRELSTWQTSDMHRRKPATKTSRWRRHQKSASTLIRPHSRYETERSHRYQRKLRGRLRRRKKPSTEQARLRYSTRPILRESLYQELVTRMTQAFSETVTWKA